MAVFSQKQISRFQSEFEGLGVDPFRAMQMLIDAGIPHALAQSIKRNAKGEKDTARWDVLPDDVRLALRVSPKGYQISFTPITNAEARIDHYINDLSETVLPINRWGFKQGKEVKARTAFLQPTFHWQQDRVDRLWESADIGELYRGGLDCLLALATQYPYLSETFAVVATGTCIYTQRKLYGTGRIKSSEEEPPKQLMQKQTFHPYTTFKDGKLVLGFNDLSNLPIEYRSLVVTA